VGSHVDLMILFSAHFPDGKPLDEADYFHFPSISSRFNLNSFYGVVSHLEQDLAVNVRVIAEMCYAIRMKLNKMFLLPQW
jgi:hypothetical protein